MTSWPCLAGRAASRLVEDHRAGVVCVVVAIDGVRSVVSAAQGPRAGDHPQPGTICWPPSAWQLAPARAVFRRGTRRPPGAACPPRPRSPGRTHRRIPIDRCVRRSLRHEHRHRAGCALPDPGRRLRGPSVSPLSKSWSARWTRNPRPASTSIGNLKGVGKIWQYTAVDGACSSASPAPGPERSPRRRWPISPNMTSGPPKGRSASSSSRS
jgi:hypothetical protein